MRTPQPGPPAGALFAELTSRCRDQQGALAAIAREAQGILDRYEADARDTADRLMIDARLEAARLLTDARRELDALNRQIAALQQAQGEAALTLQQTRRALDAALGSMPPGHGAAAGGVGRSLSSAAPVRAPASTRSAQSRKALRYLGPVMASATATLAVAAAVWLLRPFYDDALRHNGVTADFASSPAPVPASSNAGRQTLATRAAAKTGRRVTIALEARRSSWVRATRDGTGEPGGVLQAGNRRVISASRHASVRVGDAGAVLVSVNGGPLQPFGRDGQPATRVFGARDREPSRNVPIRTASAPVNAIPRPPERAASATHLVPTTGSLPLSSDEAAPKDARPVAAVPANVSTPSAASSRSTQGEILETDRQWFEGFYRGDRVSMGRLTAPGFELADSRAPGDRFMAGSAPPQRMLRDVRVDVHGDGAVLSARMIERSADGGRERESFVSEVWVKRDGAWRLLGIRLASGAQVRQAAGSLR